MSGKTYSYTEGEGTPIVFLHGWLGSKKSWNRVIEELDTTRPVLAVDQRCHGDAECTAFSFEDLADDLQALIQELGLEKPVLAGHSMGGMTALAYSARYPVESMFLVSTSASKPEPENESVEYFLENLDSMPRAEWAEKIVENYTSPDTKYGKMAHSELVNASKEQLEHPLRAMVEYDVRGQLEPVSSIVIAAERDGAITREKSEELAELLDAELETIDSSHLVLFEKPVEIAAMLEDFLS